MFGKPIRGLKRHIARKYIKKKTNQSMNAVISESKEGYITKN